MEFIAHGYQEHCIRRIINLPRTGLFLDMGLGKTVTVLTAVKELKYNRFEVNKVLVVAPKKWQKERGAVKRTSGTIQKCYAYHWYLALRQRG